MYRYTCHGCKYIKKNKSQNATWNDGYSYFSKDDESNFVAFAYRYDNAGFVEICGPSGVSSVSYGVSGGVQTLVYASNDDEDLT